MISQFFSFSVITVGKYNIGTDKISILYIGTWLFCIAPNIVIAPDIVIALLKIFGLIKSNEKRCSNKILNIT